MKGTPNPFSTFSMRDFGAADPPQMIAFRLDTSYFSRSINCRTPIQTVGTPAVIVTFSSWINERSDFASGRDPGNTCFVPIHAAANGIPHALTWNIGTTGITASASRIPRTSAELIARAWRQIPRWEYGTPFG